MPSCMCNVTFFEHFYVQNVKNVKYETSICVVVDILNR